MAYADAVLAVYVISDRTRDWLADHAQLPTVTCLSQKFKALAKPLALFVQDDLRGTESHNACLNANLMPSMNAGNLCFDNLNGSRGICDGHDLGRHA